MQRPKTKMPSVRPTMDINNNNNIRVPDTNNNNNDIN